VGSAARLGEEFVLLGNATDDGAHTTFELVTRAFWGSERAAHPPGAAIALLAPVEADAAFTSARRFANIRIPRSSCTNTS